MTRRPDLLHTHTDLPSKLLRILLMLIWVTQLQAAKPPKQLQKVIDGFMNMKSTSLRIDQVIDWRFRGENDSLYLDMDIKGNQVFHVTLPAFGMEIFVTNTQMISLNHARQQVILETASPTALLDQLFVGGDLRDAKFKKETALKGGGKQLDFIFSGDFSDWDQLSVRLNTAGILTGMTLIDYDGNKYLISISYRSDYHDFILPDLAVDYPHYQIADLRDNK